MADIPYETLKRQLLAARPDLSGMDLDVGDVSGDILFSRVDWVPAWEDRSHVVSSEDDGLTATRAITSEGRLIWLVRNTSFRRAFHARSANAPGAFDEARCAWQRRAEFRNHKAEVRRIVRELRFLRVRHDVTVDDAYASPLCEEGVDGFLRTLRLSHYRRFPGWLIAWLSVFDRQVGFVLYEARKRHEAAAGHKRVMEMNRAPDGQPNSEY